jgi:hypothetical protein
MVVTKIKSPLAPLFQRGEHMMFNTASQKDPSLPAIRYDLIEYETGNF